MAAWVRPRDARVAEEKRRSWMRTKICFVIASDQCNGFIIQFDCDS